MFDITNSINRLRRDIVAARQDIDREREKLDRREQGCTELEKLLEPLAALTVTQVKRPLPEPVKEKMRASQKARWEKRRQAVRKDDNFLLDVDSAEAA